MPFQKTGLPFLYDDASGDVIGVRDADGGEIYWPNAVFTWATLPPANRCARSRVTVSDAGVGAGLRVVSDGNRWLPDGPQVLARSAVAASITGTVNETALATVPIPAGLLGTDGGLLVYSTWTVTNSANNKTNRIRLGGIAGTAFMAAVSTAVATQSDIRRIRNRASAASQVASTAAGTALSTGTTTAAITTGAVDTSMAQDLVLSGQLASAGEQITLENYEVWVTP